MSNLPLQDPETIRLRSELQATLSRMSEGLQRLAHRKRDELPCRAVTFRMDPALEARLSRFMRQAGITNQARALRLLVAMALSNADAKG